MKWAALCLAAACAVNHPATPPDSGDGDAGPLAVLQCQVVQIRNGDCSCAEAQPPGVLSGPDAGREFTMRIFATGIDVPGSFSCSAGWDGGVLDGGFSCGITGCPYEGCTACNTSCGFVTWVISPQDPAGRPMDAGQFYAGIPYDNSFAAHCQ